MAFDGSLVRDTLIAPAGAPAIASFDPIEPPPFYTSGPADVPSCIQAAFAPLAGWIPGVTSAVDVATEECGVAAFDEFLTPPPLMDFADWRQIFSVARLGEFQVPLRSDAAERANILLAAQAIDKAEIEPGQVFSFNEVVGERTPDRGYQDGWMFDNGRLIRGTGGGICLIATGVYNAALRAGLQPIERHAHSGLVSYAPPGCDAAVVFGVEDLKFKNTTSSPIIVRTIAEDDRVIVALFGSTPPDGYRVDIEPQILEYLQPKTIEQVDATVPEGQTVVEQKPRAGFVVRVERTFLEDGRVLRRETIATERRPARDKIVRVAPAPPPAPASDDDVAAFLLNMA